MVRSHILYSTKLYTQNNEISQGERWELNPRLELPQSSALPLGDAHHAYANGIISEFDFCSYSCILKAASNSLIEKLSCLIV